jgi:hypothetical protein
MRASFANIAGVQTRFFQHGEGDYGVVLIHGVGVGADSWLWNLEALGQGRTAVASTCSAMASPAKATDKGRRMNR